MRQSRHADPGAFLPARNSRISASSPTRCSPMPSPWSEALRRLRMTHPDTPVTVLVQRGHAAFVGRDPARTAGRPVRFPRCRAVDDLVETIMDATGFKRMRRYLADNPPQSEMQRRRIVGALPRSLRDRRRDRRGPRPARLDTGPDRADDADLRGMTWPRSPASPASPCSAPDGARARSAHAERFLVHPPARPLPRRCPSGSRLRSAMTLRITLVS